METKHTKGEWVYLKLEDDSFAVKEKGLFKNGEWTFSDRICTLEHYTKENEANAKLIAAAPELLEALIYYFDVLEEVRGQDWNDKPDHVLIKMINAVNKATK